MLPWVLISFISVERFGTSDTGPRRSAALDTIDTMARARPGGHSTSTRAWAWAGSFGGALCLIPHGHQRFQIVRVLAQVHELIPHGFRLGIGRTWNEAE